MREVEGHAPRKRFGQNFLVSEGVVRKIIHAIAPQRGDILVEIVPGLGALTRPLLDSVDHLHVVEIDRDLIARLREALSALEGERAVVRRLPRRVEGAAAAAETGAVVSIAPRTPSARAERAWRLELGPAHDSAAGLHNADGRAPAYQRGYGA